MADGQSLIGRSQDTTNSSPQNVEGDKDYEWTVSLELVDSDPDSDEPECFVVQIVALILSHS